MTQEIDLESVLRSYFCVDPANPVGLTMRTNDEGRIVAKIGTGLPSGAALINPTAAGTSSKPGKH